MLVLRGFADALKLEMCPENRFTRHVYDTCLRFHLEKCLNFDIVVKIYVFPRLANASARKRIVI